MYRFAPILAACVALVAGAALRAQDQDGVSFKSGIDLVNVTATVTDGDGRFVSGLQRDDFSVFEDGRPQEITYFSNERVPVSLGIALDTSGSMTSEKMSAARAAIDRFVFDLLGPEDELFFLQFANQPHLVQEWTLERRAISRAVTRVIPAGGTALWDAIADGVPIAETGRHPKKALLVISDGNDTNSRISTRELRTMIRESEVLVYALGVDGTATETRAGPAIQLPPIPMPFPIPGGGRRRLPPIVGGGSRRMPVPERVNADALRQITDDTGGRTEVIRGFRNLEDATTRLADELRKQYALGYASPSPKDGRWHDIKVEVKDRRLAVRARRGYVAS